MSLVALGSVKGSPGVTTAAVALGAAWPAHRQVIVAELDPAGGDLAARFGLAAEPGLVSLATAARREAAPGLLERHCQALPGGLPVLAGPLAAEQAASAVELLSTGLLPALAAGTETDVLADCGRLDPGSPALPFALHADLVLLLARPVPAELGHLAARVAALSPACRALAVVLAGTGPYPPAEVARSLGVRVAGVLPHDQRGAAALCGAPARPGALRRAPLLRAARNLAEAASASVAAAAGHPTPARAEAQEVPR